MVGLRAQRRFDFGAGRNEEEDEEVLFPRQELMPRSIPQEFVRL